MSLPRCQRDPGGSEPSVAGSPPTSPLTKGHCKQDSDHSIASSSFPPVRKRRREGQSPPTSPLKGSALDETVSVCGSEESICVSSQLVTPSKNRQQRPHSSNKNERLSAVRGWVDKCIHYSVSDAELDSDEIGIDILGNLTGGFNPQGASVIPEDSSNRFLNLLDCVAETNRANSSGSEAEVTRALSCESVELDIAASDSEVDLNSGGDISVREGSSAESTASGSDIESVYNPANEPQDVHATEDSEDDGVSDVSDNASNESVASEVSAQTVDMLYPSASQTKEESVLSLMDLYVREKWTKKSLQETLTVVRAMLPAENSLPSSLHLLFKYVESFSTPISENRHYYCPDCKISKQNKHDVCVKCNEKKWAVFYEFPADAQMKHMFEHRNLAAIIDSHRQNQSDSGTFISDVQDGEECKKIQSQLKGKYDIVLIWNIDGLSVSGSSGMEAWPILGVICNIPYTLRSSYIVVCGVWCDVKKPPGDLFLKPFVTRLKSNFESGGVEWKHPQSNEMYKSVVVAPVLSADAPAKALALCTRHFSHRYGCNTCEQKTVRIPRTPLGSCKKCKSKKA